MPDNPDAMTAKEAADFLFTTENSLRSMRSLGVGPPFEKVGRRVTYSRSALDAYVASLRASDLTQLRKRRERAEKERGASVEIRTRP